MLDTREALARRVESAQDLLSITRAMKALSAMRIRQSKAAVDSLEAYASTVELGLQIALMNRPGPRTRFEAGARGPTGAVLFGSDLGLVGQYNLRIVEYASSRLAQDDLAAGKPVSWVAVGERVGSLLDEAGQEVVGHLPAPHSVEEITSLTDELVVLLEELRETLGWARILLFYSHHHAGSVCRPSAVQLYPLSAEWLGAVESKRRSWDSRCLPVFRTPWATLFSEVVREQLFVTLFRAAAESLASEYASRLMAMQGAERQIEETLGRLRGEHSQRLKEDVTEELLDLIAGYRALVERRDGNPKPAAWAKRNSG